MKIAEFYKGKHAQSKGKNIFYIISSHREVMASLPKEFDCEIDHLFDYCGSFEIAMKGNGKPIPVKVTVGTKYYSN